MDKPIIFTIDDDAEVLRAIERDLRRGFGKDYRVLRAESGASALEALRKLRLRDEPVALLLADQKMPGLSGVEFLEQARQLYPDAKCALLTAYADTDAAIRAINNVRIDYYLLKPWDPPEERLYPVLQDMLDDWQAGYRPRFDGVRVIGHRWSRQSHDIKDFLARNQIPYQWLDADSDSSVAVLLTSMQRTGADLPIVLYTDGAHQVQPTTMQVAQKVGLRTQTKTPFYDLVIVGAGPAGLAAAVYGASEGLATLMIERSAPGGQASQSSAIENYLGFPTAISGADLTRRALTQAERFGAELLRPQEAQRLRLEGSYKLVALADGSEVSCHALIIATGINYRRLDVPGIDRLTGAGVYYGSAMTEALSCRDGDVYVVGAGNSAAQAALYLTKYAGHVTLVCRGESLVSSMSQYLVDRVIDEEGITKRMCSHVTAVHGENNLEAITICHVDTGQEETVPARALFIFIGAVPYTEWTAGVVQRDQHGFILSGPDLLGDGKRPKGWPLDREPYWLETNVPGIFVAGDVRQNSIKRVASAVGEGAMAVAFVHKYLASL
ncbi:MAG: FAD-dependent oxidoreductase [Anaerolineales bacterium]|nr:FAD-dependent oxidoreductase [Anaerolineales bacterium]